MLFKTKEGTLIEIKRSNYHNDQLYYKSIMMMKKKYLTLNSMDIFWKGK